MSDTLFPNLITPLPIGDLSLRNRIFAAGHDTVMVHDGRVTDQLVEYHRAGAAGGAGLIIMQVAGIQETARYTSQVLMASGDDCIEGFRRVAEAVHPYGCAVFGQVFHPGWEITGSADAALLVEYAPSRVLNERFHVMARPMPQAMIGEIVAGYAAAARRLQQAGLDGVEIVAGDGYLPAQFLDPEVNRRADRYGGDLGNRMRFLAEIVAAVRASVGPEFAVGVGVCAARYPVPEDDPSEVVEVCRRLDADRLLDYVNVTEGELAGRSGSPDIVGPIGERADYLVSSAARIKAAVAVPVLVAGRRYQPLDAEAVIASGRADACAMTPRSDPSSRHIGSGAATADVEIGSTVDRMVPNREPAAHTPVSPDDKSALMASSRPFWPVGAAGLTI